MGRPKGTNPRSVVQSVRLTPVERDKLVDQFGSVSKALRHLVNEHLRMAGLAGEHSSMSVPMVVPQVEKMKRGGKIRGHTVDKVIVDEAQQLNEATIHSVSVTKEGPGNIAVAQHRHRRGVEVEPVYEQGTKKKRYVCAVQGCEETLG